jgi:hypothetical protein
MENKELEEVASNLAIKSVKEYMKTFPSCDNTFDYRRGFEEGFIEGVKYQAERMYSEGEVRQISLDFFYHWWNSKGTNTEQGFDKWFEQFKTTKDGK